MRSVIEERREQRGRERGSGCCSCIGDTLSFALMCRRAACAACLVACKLADSPPLAAAWAPTLCARMRTHRADQVAVRERVATRGASALIVLLLICALTMVEADMLSAADPEPLTSLHHTQQQQCASALCMSHAMRRGNVHVDTRC